MQFQLTRTEETLFERVTFFPLKIPTRVDEVILGIMGEILVRQNLELKKYLQKTSKNQIE